VCKSLRGNFARFPVKRFKPIAIKYYAIIEAVRWKREKKKDLRIINFRNANSDVTSRINLRETARVFQESCWYHSRDAPFSPASLFASVREDKSRLKYRNLVITLIYVRFQELRFWSLRPFVFFNAFWNFFPACSWTGINEGRRFSEQLCIR